MASCGSCDPDSLASGSWGRWCGSRCPPRSACRRPDPAAARPPSAVCPRAAWVVTLVSMPKQAASAWLDDQICFQWPYHILGPTVWPIGSQFCLCCWCWQHKYVFSLFWRLKFWDEGAGRAGFIWGSPWFAPSSHGPPSGWVQPGVCLCILISFLSPLNQILLNPVLCLQHSHNIS